MGFEPRPPDCSGCEVSGLQYGATTPSNVEKASRVSFVFFAYGPSDLSEIMRLCVLSYDRSICLPAATDGLRLVLGSTNGS